LLAKVLIKIFSVPVAAEIWWQKFRQFRPKQNVIVFTFYRDFKNAILYAGVQMVKI